MRESSLKSISEFNRDTIRHLCNRINNKTNNDNDAIQEPYSINSNQENNGSVALAHRQSSMAISSSVQENN